MVKSSYIFFGSICKMSYDDFKKEEVDYLDDLRSQIYVNSKIATAKFKNYKGVTDEPTHDEDTLSLPTDLASETDVAE